MAKRLPEERHFKRTLPAAAPAPKRNARFTFFVLVVCFFGLANFLVLNDVITVWSGAEGRLFYAASTDSVGSYLPAQVIQPYVDLGGEWLFKSRLNGVLLLVFSLAMFGLLGRALLGKQTVIFTIMVILASFLLPIHAKLATGDLYVLLGQLLFWLLVLQHLKNPAKKEYALLLVAGIFCAVAAPLHSFLLTLGLGTALWYWHPAARHIWRWHGWLFIAAPTLAIPFMGDVALLGHPFLIWSLTLGDYFTLLGYTILGLAPFFGFLVAGLRDLLYKLRRGEELALVLTVSLAAAFVAQSLLLPVLLSLVVAKQLIAYFVEKYPWRNWVRTGALLHLVGTFVLIVFILVGGYLNLGPDTFRAALGSCLAYWMFSFVGVVGLYGMRYDLTWGGPILAGTAALLFFWLQLYPNWEELRDWPRELATKVRAADVDHLITEESEAVQVAYPYLKQVLDLTVASSPQLPIVTPDSANVVWYLTKDSLPPSAPLILRDTIPAYNAGLGSVTWRVYELKE